MTRDEMKIFLNNGYAFIEEIFQTGQMIEMDIEDLRIIEITSCKVEYDEKVVLIHSWEWKK